ncbi:MAG: short-chain dehydrogenase [Porticoccaceae bacterium]|nr:MAG: short-chain dehydrogenase [Porticoccaceae bacterium]
MSQCQFDYRNRVVFVAGGTSGINLGIATGFAKAGATLAVMSRSQQKVDTAVDVLKGQGSHAIGFAADVRDVDSLKEVFEQVFQELGPIDVLVSGAAGNFPAAANEMSANAFKVVIDIDLLGTFNVLRYSYKYLRKPGASIINISAPQAFVPMEMQSHVCAAKAGVDMITRTTAMEWGPEGIRVNSLVPGPIEGTEGMKRLTPPGSTGRQIVINSVPMKRQGTVEDMANAAMFVASDAASYINGAVIPVDGGWGLGGAGQLGQGLADMVKSEK